MEVECVLSEIFNGCKKSLTYTKQVLNPDGQSVKEVKETKILEIEPGRSKNNPIVFKGQGNQEPGQHPSHLLFQIVEKGEMNFDRSATNPDDLIYTANISLMDALDSKSLEIVRLF